MKVVKYWQVELFQDTGFRADTSVMSSLRQKPLEQAPFFTGYSLKIPDFNVADDKFIEIMVSIDDVEARRIRRSLIGSVRVTPVYANVIVGKNGSDDEEHAKAADDKALVPPGFEEAARPLMKWMAENLHPHHTAIVDQSSAELSSGLQYMTTPEYIRD